MKKAPLASNSSKIGETLRTVRTEGQEELVTSRVAESPPSRSAGREVAGATPAGTKASRLADLAGDMWNELDNLRDLWTGTDREVHCEMLIEQYEAEVF